MNWRDHANPVEQARLAELEAVTPALKAEYTRIYDRCRHRARKADKLAAMTPYNPKQADHER